MGGRDLSLGVFFNEHGIEEFFCLGKAVYLMLSLSVKGLTVRLKFIGKTNWLLILLFLIIPCISDRNLFILAIILLNLIQK